MTKKIIIMVLLPSLFIYLTGCYSMYDVQKEDIKTTSHPKIQVLTNNGDSYLFQEYAYLIKGDTLYGKIFNENQASVKMNIPLKDIASIQTEKINGVTTVLTVLGVAVVLVGIVVLIVQAAFAGALIGSVR